MKLQKRADPDLDFSRGDDSGGSDARLSPTARVFNERVLPRLRSDHVWSGPTGRVVMPMPAQFSRDNIDLLQKYARAFGFDARLTQRMACTCAHRDTLRYAVFGCHCPVEDWIEYSRHYVSETAAAATSKPKLEEKTL